METRSFKLWMNDILNRFEFILPTFLCDSEA